ncbi:hypothetical protein BJ138DRAFT_1101424 [Hygrophoropsis aurantiaca]|uniref:Uncharacterized protein n=1 Tax=Hygrophoropsis aurantiaca TaxID=72124 RepID=A0ACB8ACB3_9AGAM|nr:hypothetical protein BJ138DRAFT_1101424 [Hygrophoropsis aurantiaca]
MGHRRERLFDRWRTRRFWWEDAWATIALLFDIACFVALWIQAQVRVSVADKTSSVDVITSWIQSLAFTAARLSVTFSVIRVANHRPQFQRFALCVAGLFGLMWIGLLAQKIYICDRQGCIVQQSLAITQLLSESNFQPLTKQLKEVWSAADIISDTILVAMPFFLLRGVKISHNRTILIYCAFFASILITLITIFHAILLFRADKSAIVGTVAHVKTAVSLIVCNLLVIVTFGYRACRKFGGVDLEHSFVASEAILFTSVDLNQLTNSVEGEGSAVDTEANPESYTNQDETHSSTMDKSPATTITDVESSRCQEVPTSRLSS